jgi:anaerobic selenocysteine-containing dehydrogenase
LRGGIWQSPPLTASFAAVLKPPAIEVISPSANETEYPFHFLPYEHLTLGLGSHANLPLAQELPDPMTSICWNSWIEVNPDTAAKLGVRDGDVVQSNLLMGASMLL